MSSGTDWNDVGGQAMLWLAGRRRELIEDLAASLDLDAGVYDTTIQSQHRAIADDLSNMLNLDAGLAAVAGAGSASPSGSQPPKPPPTQRRAISNTSDLIEVLADAPPSVLLALRRPMHDYLEALNLVDEMGIVRTYARRLVRYVPDLERDSNRLARRARNAAETLNEYLTRVRRNRFGPELHDRLTGVEALARVIAALDPDRSRDVALARRRGTAVLSNRDLDREMDLALAHAIDIAYACSEQHGIGRAIGRSLKIAFVSTGDILALYRLRNDFTSADLREIDLAALLSSGADLNGMRWSDRTLWPGTWSDWARSNSVQLGAGLYEIRPGRGISESDRTLVPH